MNSPTAWSDDGAIAPAKLNRGRAVLIAIIAVTCLLPLAFVTPEDAPLHVNVFKYLAKIGAFVGSMLLIWQFLLGFRGAISSLLPDLNWVVDVHKKLGQFGVPIVLLHPIFIGLFYMAEKDQNIFSLDLADGFSQFVLLGMVLLALIAFIVISSAFFREKLGFYPWLYTHLSSYLVPPLMFIHSFLLGPTIQGTFVQYYWWFWAVVIAALMIYRVAHKLGATSGKFTVVGTREVAENTTEIRMKPEGAGPRPERGQFVYLRRSWQENSHPYTASIFEDDGDVVGVTLQAEGGQSTALQDAKKGDTILLDGPFGVFTRVSAAKPLPLVMIAGGIGITPFKRMWEALENSDREAHLFYGNEKYSQMVYRDELDALEHVNVVHVLNDEDDWEGETGFVDADLLSRNLPKKLTEYQFLVCGPPVMIETLEEDLTEHGVPASQVAYELFAS